MSRHSTQLVATRLCALIVLFGATAFGIGCNYLTGANEIDFTPDDDDSGGDGGGGGAGGADSTAFEFSCGDGNIAVGFYGRSGAWVDALGLMCAPYQADGTLGEVFKTDTAGGDGGGMHDAPCPTDQALVGIEISRASHPVRLINPLCQTLAEWKIADTPSNAAIGLGDPLAESVKLVCNHGGALFKVTGEIGLIPGYTTPFVLTAAFLCKGT